MAGAIPRGAFGVVVDARTDWKPFLLGAIGSNDVGSDGPGHGDDPQARAKAVAVLPVGISEDMYQRADVM